MCRGVKKVATLRCRWILFVLLYQIECGFGVTITNNGGQRSIMLVVSTTLCVYPSSARSE
jgi:hypothetical protein